MWKIHDSGFLAAGLSAAYEAEDLIWASNTCTMAIYAGIVALVLFFIAVWKVK